MNPRAGSSLVSLPCWKKPLISWARSLWRKRSATRWTGRTKKDRLRGELDYEVNRRAEAEIQGLAHKINLIGDKIGDVEELLRNRIEN